MSKNTKILNKFKGYYLEDTNCHDCLYYKGKKAGCSLTACCCEDIKQDALEHGKIKRERGALRWDG